MKTVYAFCILLFVFSGQVFAQLRCNFCDVTPAGGTTTVSSGDEYIDILAAAGNGTFTGNIVLKSGAGSDGTSHFSCITEGHYKIDGVISSQPGPAVGITLYAQGAENWGGYKAGVTFAGSAPNTYTGPTIIKEGYIACHKTERVVAIPGDIIFRAIPDSKPAGQTYPKAEASLWFGADHQLSGRSKVYFDMGVVNFSNISLNGTTQTLTGLETNINGPTANEYANVYNLRHNDPTNIPGTPQNKTKKAILILDGGYGGSNPYTFGGTYNSISGSSGNSGLEIQVKGTGQKFGAVEFIENVTFDTDWRSQIEFSPYGPPKSLGNGITFKGNGTIKMTKGNEGTVLSLAGSTLSMGTGGRVWVASGELKNSSNTKYPTAGRDRNAGVLQVDAGAAFDLNGRDAIFGGLRGSGNVKSTPYYSTLTLVNTETQIFNGELQTIDNFGGVIIEKRVYGTQIFTGDKMYVNRISVAAGMVKLQGGAKLHDGTFEGILEISNAGTTVASFEHNGAETQIFKGIISGMASDNGLPAVMIKTGIFRQSGTGKSIITGAKDFTGKVEITGGFLGGNGNLRKAHSVTVGPQGSIGGGNGTESAGDILTVAALTFASPTSTLVVTTKSDNVPSLVEVRTSDESWAAFNAPTTGFTVDILGDNIVGGYLIKCLSAANRPLPTLGRHKTGKAYCFSWDATGLLMSVSSGTNPLLTFNQPPDITINSGDSQPVIQFSSSAEGNQAPTGYQWRQKGPHTDVIEGLADNTTDWRTAIAGFRAPFSTTTLRRSLEVVGRNPAAGCMVSKTFTYTVEPIGSLTCDNCTFTPVGSTAEVTGTTAAPATILSGNTGEFAGNIFLNGPCNFTIRNPANFTLSGTITGAGPLTYHANEAGAEGKNAGITLSGTAANTYSGQTNLTGGYLICNKTNAVAIPHNLKLAATAGTLPAHLWCLANNQTGSHSVVDFGDAVAWSYLHLNGTTQNIAGLTGNNTNAVVENWETTYRPASMAGEQPTGGAVLNIAVAADNTAAVCMLGGGVQIRRGTTTQALTVNVTRGTQIIENPTISIKYVTFTSTGESILQFNTNTATTYSLGDSVIFEGTGLIKKTGVGVLALAKASVLKSGGQIWVSGGTLQNEATAYSRDAISNAATLRLEAATGSPAAIFDLRGINSIFGGLAGDGVVQNNFGSAGTSPAGGYNQLLLTLTDTLAFTGVIRDNSGNVAPESNGGEGKGGIALKIEGNNMIQNLSGVNLYTGSTTVSSGKLALTGAGQLAGGTYAGVLEISNAAAASQATFEHNGTATQTFTGDITATGEGTVKGIFLQSGTGKTILTGAKTFTGDVNITGGFLGGTGTLESVNSVSLDGTGSIGAGNGATATTTPGTTTPDTTTPGTTTPGTTTPGTTTPDTTTPGTTTPGTTTPETPTTPGTTTPAANEIKLIVKNLVFKSETAKIIATSQLNNTPALVEVQALPTAATNVSRFIVDVLGGATLLDGYLLKYPDNTTPPTGLPTPIVGENNTGKSVRLVWDNVGLLMQISHGAVTMNLLPASVCPKGSNPGNPRIIFTVTYSDVLDLPAEDALFINYITLSDNNVKSGDLVVNKADRVITAEFDGANTTDADLPYTIIYNDGKNGVIRTNTRINRKPVLSISTGVNPTCVGASLVLQGVGHGAGTISSQHTAIATVGSTTAALTAPVTSLTPGNVDFLLTDPDGCRSEYFNVAVLDTAPVLEAANATICAAVNGVGNTTLLTANQAPVAAPAIAWAINPPVAGASVEAAGNMTASFTITNAALAAQTQFTVEYTNFGGCKGRTVITVNPSPAITPAGSVICAAVSGAGNSVNLEASQDPGVPSAWTVNEPADASLEDVTPTDRSAVFRITNTALTAQKPITVEYTGQAGCKGISVITVNPTPVISANGTDLTKLCAGTAYADALTVSGNITGNWTVYRTGHTMVSNIATGVTASSTAGRGNIQAGNAYATLVEDVVFISEASCTSPVFPITIHPKPLINPIVSRAYCHDTDVPAFIPASSGNTPEARPTHYQWNMADAATNHDNIHLDDYIEDWTKPAVSAFRSPNIQTIQKRDITIKGYNSSTGCVSESQVFTITIKQGLELEHKSTSPICSGTDTNVFFLSSLSDTNYTWTVPDNTVGATSVATPSPSARISQRLTNSGNSAASVNYTVRAASGTSNNCTATFEVTVMVSTTQAATPSVIGGGNYCADFEGSANTYKTNLIPSASGTNVEWTYTSSFPDTQMPGIISGNTQKWEKGPLTALADDLVLSGQEPAVVNYVFRPFTDCLGIPSNAVAVRIHPVPVAPPVVANSTRCSSSTLHPVSANIALDNPAGLVYTWTVDKANSPDVSGYTEPSRAGVVVPGINPPAASALIADHLLLPATATEAQTIVYKLTPWRSGCPGKVVSTSVVVNLLPVVNAPANRQYCANTAVEAEILTGTQGANAFKWSGGSAAGLADQANYGTGLPAYTSAAEITPEAATVSLLAKNANGCESADPVTFTLAVVARPVLTLGNSRELCTGSIIATAAATKIGITPAESKYKWGVQVTGEGAEGVKIVKDGEERAFPVTENTLQTGDLAQKITAVNAGVATLTFTVQPFLGSCGGNEVTTTVQVRGKDLSTGIANNSQGICNDGQANIKVGDAGDGNQYSWTVSDNVGNVQGEVERTVKGDASTISDVLSLSDTRRGNVTYKIATSQGECDGAVVSQTVFVNPVPVLFVFPEGASAICSGGRTNISLSNNLGASESSSVVYSWEVSADATLEGAAPNTGTSDRTVQQALLNKGTVEGSATYTFTPRFSPADGYGSCPGGAVTVVYNVKLPVNANIKNEAATKKVCLGDPAVILEVTELTGASYQWLKDDTDIPGATEKSYRVETNTLSASIYSVRVSLLAGCSVPASRSVEVSKDFYFEEGKVEVTIAGNAVTGTTNVEINKPVDFKYSGPVAEHSWDFKDTTPAVTTPNVVHSYQNSGPFVPTLTVVKAGQPGCTKTFILHELNVTPMAADLNSSMTFSVFPVPAEDRITIVNEGDDMQSIAIRNTNGMTVLDQAVAGRRATLSVEHLSSGIYLLTVTHSKGVQHLKIIKR